MKPTTLKHDVTLNHDNVKHITVVKKKSAAEQRATENIGVERRSHTIKDTGGMYVPPNPAPRSMPQGGRTVIHIVLDDTEIDDE